VKLDLNKLVVQAFKTLGSTVDGAVRKVTYRAASGAQTYDPVTGSLTSPTTSYPSVEAVFAEFSRKEKDTDFQSNQRQSIEVGDVECLIAYGNLPIKVSMEDTILDGTTKWRIVDYSLDPTGRVLHTFHLRMS
jgi:hypothetical protein